MNASHNYGLAWFADYYLLSTLLLGVVLLAGVWMRQPARRLALAWATAAGLLLLGALLAVPGWSVVHLLGSPAPRPVLHAAPEVSVLSPLVETTLPRGDFESLPTNAPPVPAETARPAPAVPQTLPAEFREVDFSPYFLWPLLVGSGLVLGWLLLGAWQTNRLVRNSSPPPPEVQSLLEAIAPEDRSRPVVRISRGVATGVALGLVRPTILLPQKYADCLDAPTLQAVLAHELAHLRGGDLWLLAVLRLLMIALWANPLYWLLRRRVRLDQETLADAAAAELTSRTAYAEQLVGWARQLDTVSPPTLAGAVGLWETKSQLHKRIAVLLDERLTILRGCSRKWKLAALAFCGVAALGLSLLTIEPGEAVGDEPAAATESEVAVQETPAEKIDDADAPQINRGTLSDGVIEGRVTDRSGQPIAGAEVGLVDDELEPNEPPTFKRIGITDRDGRFALPYDESDRRTFMSVWACAEGFGPSRDASSTVAAELDRRDNLGIELQRVGSTEIRLLDVDRQPVEGASLSVVAVRVPRSVGWALPTNWKDRFSGTSDAGGLIRIAGLVPDSLSEMHVESESGGRLQFDQNYFLNAQPEGNGPHYTICVPATATIRGTVVADDESAPKPQMIRLATELWPGSRNDLPDWATWAGVWGIAEVSPDATGEFQVLRIAAGMLRVDAPMPTDQPWRAMTPANQRIAAGDTVDVAISVVRGIEVRGRVVKKDTGEGYPNFQLSLVHGPTDSEVRRSGTHYQVTTDEAGWYRATLPPGWVKLRNNSAPQDYRDVEYWKPEAESLNLRAREIPANVTEFELPPLELVPTKHITGKLIDKNGRALDDWVVYGYPELEDNIMNSFAGVHTNREGEFKGYVAETLIPKLWKVSFRDWSDVYDFDDQQYIAKIVSEEPLVLQVDVDGRTDQERQAEE